MLNVISSNKLVLYLTNLASCYTKWVVQPDIEFPSEQPFPILLCFLILFGMLLQESNFLHTNILQCLLILNMPNGVQEAYMDPSSWHKESNLFQIQFIKIQTLSKYIYIYIYIRGIDWDMYVVTTWLHIYLYMSINIYIYT